MPSLKQYKVTSEEGKNPWIWLVFGHYAKWPCGPCLLICWGWIEIETGQASLKALSEVLMMVKRYQRKQRMEEGTLIHIGMIWHVTSLIFMHQMDDRSFLGAFAWRRHYCKPSRYVYGKLRVQMGFSPKAGTAPPQVLWPCVCWMPGHSTGQASVLDLVAKAMLVLPATEIQVDADG